jgi:hypothetical protein
VRENIFSKAASNLLETHFEHLSTGSGISAEVILERGYESILGKANLVKLGFSRAQQHIPGILIPLWGVDGKEAGYQYRPDSPRVDGKGRPVKYESPPGAGNRLDLPRRCLKTLGDPNTPLWITEGSKKADALASHQACVVSVTGVWGFKGKNDSGGITILSDWDYVALRGRTVYLAFDSDIMTKAPVQKALLRLSEHLSRKGAKVLVIHLPHGDNGKTGIDDYLLTHSVEEAIKLAVVPDSLESESQERSVPGFISAEGVIGEMVIGGGERAFVVALNGSVRKAYRYEAGRVTYLPMRDMLVGEVVHFARSAEPYESQSKLFSQVRKYIHRYLELPADYEEIAALYVLLTWVYEFAPSIPYLRVIGDWGSGKTRFLQVVGSVCFRPIFASGATTPAPVFRILEQYRGTLVLDEADFKDSSAWVEMVKLLNNGYRPGMPVLRADKENGKWYPRSYRVFGPKLIATRYSFRDEALESRCLTSEMMPLTRDDIPRVLPPSFSDEVEALRAKLLTFRLANLLRLKGKTFGNELVEPGLQPRLQEILIPLKAMLNGDQSMAEALSDFIHRLQESLYSRRRDSDAGRVLAAILELHEEGEQLSVKAIAEKITEMDEDAPILTTQKIGWLTKKLGLRKEKDGSSRRQIIHWDETRMVREAQIHGLQCSLPLSQKNTFESFDTFTPGVDSGTKDSPKDVTHNLRANENSFADSEAKPKQSKESKEFSEDKGKTASHETIGMSFEEAIALWRSEGAPVIHLGSGENCFDLVKLLSCYPVHPRHLEVVREWLKKKLGERAKPESNEGKE